MRRGWMMAAIVALVWGLGLGEADAQGGGASATGTIQGRVADTSGAVLPGVGWEGRYQAFGGNIDHRQGA